MQDRTTHFARTLMHSPVKVPSQVFKSHFEPHPTCKTTPRKLFFFQVASCKQKQGIQLANTPSTIPFKHTTTTSSLTHQDYHEKKNLSYSQPASRPAHKQENKASNTPAPTSPLLYIPHSSLSHSPLDPTRSSARLTTSNLHISHSRCEELNFFGPPNWTATSMQRDVRYWEAKAKTRVWWGIGPIRRGRRLKGWEQEQGRVLSVGLGLPCFGEGMGLW